MSFTKSCRLRCWYCVIPLPLPTTPTWTSNTNLSIQNILQNLETGIAVSISPQNTKGKNMCKQSLYLCVCCAITMTSVIPLETPCAWMVTRCTNLSFIQRIRLFTLALEDVISRHIYTSTFPSVITSSKICIRFPKTQFQGRKND